MKILVIQKKMIGDVLTSSILFEFLREKYPKAQLDYLIDKHTFPVVKHNPFIDNLVCFEDGSNSRNRTLYETVKKVRHKKYDIIIDIYCKLSTNIISLFSNSRKRISYHKYYSAFVYSDTVKRYSESESKTNLAIINRLQLLEPLGINKRLAKPQIYLSENEIKESLKFLKTKGIDRTKPLFMISVLGSSLDKTYPLKYMAKAIDTIADTIEAQILFNYLPELKEQAKEIYDLCAPQTQKQIYFDVFGGSLREFLAITAHCDALIGNEGGAINMAKALKIKTFAIYSPWIDKATWSLFEDENNVSVHLKDYSPDLYLNKIEKNMKKDALELYKKFVPELFEKKLSAFLNQIITK
jgi:heptosyltransferase-2